MSSRAFRLKKARRQGLLKGQGLGGELGVLRHQVEEGFLSLETGGDVPSVLAVHS